MTSIAHGTHGASDFEANTEDRNSHRIQGWFIAIGAGLGIWTIIGGTIWGVVSLFT